MHVSCVRLAGSSFPHSSAHVLQCHSLSVSLLSLALTQVQTVVHLLVNYLGDDNASSALDVIYFVREIVVCSAAIALAVCLSCFAAESCVRNHRIRVCHVVDH